MGLFMSSPKWNTFVEGHYLHHLASFPTQDAKARLANPVWHVHQDHPPESSPLSFSLLLHVAGACQGQNEEILWSFIRRLYPQSFRPRASRRIGLRVLLIRGVGVLSN